MPTIKYTRRDARLRLVKELVNELVDDPDNRIRILHAVSEYGHAAAMEALDGAKSAISSTLGVKFTTDEQAILDEAQARR